MLGLTKGLHMVVHTAGLPPVQVGSLPAAQAALRAMVTQCFAGQTADADGMGCPEVTVGELAALRAACAQVAGAGSTLVLRGRKFELMADE